MVIHNTIQNNIILMPHTCEQITTNSNLNTETQEYV